MSERLSAARTAHIVCVATEYGSIVMKPSYYADIRKGRLEAAAMEELIRTEAGIVFDATHPYAALVSENIRKACEAAGKEYVRVLRDADQRDTGLCQSVSAQIRIFGDAAACAEALKDTDGNLLLTTGSKELSIYAADPDVRKRLYARVLPSEESIRLCAEAGLSGKQVIAMQGPFTKEMDLALIGQFDIRVLVTKSSGRTGGFFEKLAAAEAAGIPVFIIGRPAEESGISVNEALAKAGVRPFIKADLIGTGPGRESLMTSEAKEALGQAEIIFGAGRMIEPYKDWMTYPYYRAEDIIPVIREQRPQRIAVLFSGDTGFLSGAGKLKPALEKWLHENDYDHEITIHPGVSSLAYFAARLGVPYSGAELESIHGRSDDPAAWGEIVEKVRYNKGTFILLSGDRDARNLGRVLLQYGLRHCSVSFGYQLSYPDEIIRTITPEECSIAIQKGLYIAYVKNPEPEARPLMPVMSDDSFIRTGVPMTKENIRHLSIMRLGLEEGSVLYDIGSGTGSVACEAANLSPSVRVFAIEMKYDACQLTGMNRDKFRLSNIEVIHGKAPEAFAGLEAPTHAFIGGSSGNLREILEALRSRGPIRVVINAVSLETIAEIQSLLKEFSVTDLSIEQVSVSRSKELGSYHLMTAENPVLIAAFVLGGES